MNPDIAWLLYLLGAFVLAAGAIFLGAFCANQRLDDEPLDAEALCRLSEMKRERDRLPIMLRRQAD